MATFESRAARGVPAVEINKVLRNTYALLAMTLGFSAVTASISVAMGGPNLGFLTLIGFLGLIFAVHKTADSVWGLPMTFLLTGFMGFSLGPLLSAVLQTANGGFLIAQAFALTAVAFLALSAYTISSKKDFSFLSGFLIVGFVVMIGAWIVSFFYWTPLLMQIMSVVAVMIGAALILWETSAVVRGEETNYIRATVGVYVGIYNMFSGLLALLGMGFGDD